MTVYRVHVIGAPCTGKTAYIRRLATGGTKGYEPGAITCSVQYHTAIGIVTFMLSESRGEVSDDADAFLVFYKSYETLKYAKELYGRLPKNKKIVFVETHEDLNVHQQHLPKMLRILRRMRRLGHKSFHISTRTCKQIEMPLLEVMGNGVQ